MEEKGKGRKKTNAYSYVVNQERKEKEEKEGRSTL